ncbi:aldehyde dehydrogenase family protein [Agrobacterium tumefaciens]|uniref:aldehyde dehydrogenase family protein n=1 Tax=Agrobacterium tumefaciens TaxID=358 RepID=UPI001572F913|nr:aldehyde dehydrogenase family protein [Agrobacterium tumefaciens]NTB94900.1 aldehyde dehydrogenase family protein [Agrobacterium tumefaciens]NTC44021.1 aldehyde dehydrogenase family protein [Agrobacterium tumefaciens]
MDRSYKLLIDGELVAGDHTLDVIDPSSGQVFATVARASAEQLEAAVAAAKRAFQGWSKTPLQVRRSKIVELADLIESKKGELARTLTQEQGKPLAEAEWEVENTARFMRELANIDLAVETIQDDASMRVEIHHRPLGVVAGITPWNFPFLLNLNKLTFSTLMGNTFILKPAPTTPITALLIGELAQKIFPAGVVNIVVDANDLGDRLTRHPDVAKVSFTGSTATGKKVYRTVSDTIKRLTLELGGNDAGIVLDDVDVGDAAGKIFDAAFTNAGQVCIAMKRVYAHSSIYDALCDELAKLANEAVVGNGFEQGVRIGPVQNATQFNKAKHFLDVAKRDGTVIAGGNAIEGHGYFIQPTIVRDISDGSALVDEEQFAPILPVIRFDDVDDAVARANSSVYGLGGSVWSRSIDRAREVAQEIEAGTVWINQHLHIAPNIPFGGSKESGLGADYGAIGLAEYAQRTVISVAK